jgi:hypothetical protein
MPMSFYFIDRYHLIPPAAIFVQIVSKAKLWPGVTTSNPSSFRLSKLFTLFRFPNCYHMLPLFHLHVICWTPGYVYLTLSSGIYHFPLASKDFLDASFRLYDQYLYNSLTNLSDTGLMEKIHIATVLYIQR